MFGLASFQSGTVLQPCYNKRSITNILKQINGLLLNSLVDKNMNSVIRNESTESEVAF